MSTSTPSTSSYDRYTASEWTQQNMLSDLMQQKGLLIGAGVALAVILLMRRRAAPEEKAARRLVRDLRHVDDPHDARDLITGNVPTILRPALLTALEEIETQVHQLFRRLEHDIERL